MFLGVLVCCSYIRQISNMHDLQKLFLCSWVFLCALLASDTIRICLIFRSFSFLPECYCVLSCKLTDFESPWTSEAVRVFLSVIVWNPCNSEISNPPYRQKVFLCSWELLCTVLESIRFRVCLNFRSCSCIPQNSFVLSCHQTDFESAWYSGAVPVILSVHVCCPDIGQFSNLPDLRNLFLCSWVLSCSVQTSDRVQIVLSFRSFFLFQTSSCFVLAASNYIRVSLVYRSISFFVDLAVKTSVVSLEKTRSSTPLSFWRWLWK